MQQAGSAQLWTKHSTGQKRKDSLPAGRLGRTSTVPATQDYMYWVSFPILSLFTFLLDFISLLFYSFFKCLLRSYHLRGDVLGPRVTKTYKI